MKIGRKTVRRWLRRGQFPERKPPHRRPRKVSQFADYLHQRWKEGCHNASRLYQEIREKGYTGKRSMVARFVASWRKTGKAAAPTAPERIAPRHAAILVTRPAEQRNKEQQQLLDRILVPCPEVFDLRQLALSFRDALRADQSAPLRRWIEKAISAVAAAVDMPWSNGQVEGQINRLKMIKRQMYGRAGFELLRARVLPYSPLASRCAGSIRLHQKCGRAQRTCQKQLAHRGYGYRRIREQLQIEGIVVSQKVVRRLMRNDELMAIRRRRFVVTTDSEHRFRVIPQCGGTSAVGYPNQLWVADLCPSGPRVCISGDCHRCLVAPCPRLETGAAN